MATTQETPLDIPDPGTQHSFAVPIEPRRTTWSDREGTEAELLLEREWLTANGLGGYASGTISGACTRRYHSLLIAALPAPLGRMVMFNHLAEEIKFADRQILRLDGDEPLSADERGRPCPRNSSDRCPASFRWREACRCGGFTTGRS
ncbi:MAG: glycogen debranching enzyme N-terminal domain-containing protein [Pirellulales bacterium]